VKAPSLPAAAVAIAMLSSTPSSAQPSVTYYHPSPIQQAYRSGKAAPDGETARAQYRRGIDLARAVLQRSPDDPDALLWLAANLGAEALTHGKLYALRVIGEIESTLLHLERVNPSYDHAAAARSLANLYWKAPSIISVGSTKKAAGYFELALARAPDFPGNQALAADFYLDQRDCGRARPLAQAVATRSDLDAYGPDAADWRKLAADVLRTCR
jgi:tetratricopeptide (TPR) repeat protein